ncbi:MAG TPA: hypothetical protein VMB50_22745 [Myxococcales bacterium]|nr:hypothetical protein [Myxococcales bacterium]
MLLGVLGLSTGCPSFTLLKNARALDHGEFQFTAAPEVYGGVVPTTAATPTGGTLFLPQVELGARYGIVDGFDLGLKLYIAGIELDSTIQLVRGGPVDLALEPGVGYFGIQAGSGASSAGFDAIPFQVPLLVGINFGPGHQFFFGPQVDPYVLIVDAGGSGGSSATGVELFVGGTIGLSFKVGRLFRITPEIELMSPVYASVSVNGITGGGGAGSTFGTGTFLLQGAVDFSIGGDGFNRPGDRQRTTSATEEYHEWEGR